MEGKNIIVCVASIPLSKAIKDIFESYAYEVLEYRTDLFTNRNITEVAKNTFKASSDKRIVYLNVNKIEPRTWLQGTNMTMLNDLIESKTLNVTLIALYKKHKHDRWITDLGSKVSSIIREDVFLDRMPKMSITKEDLHGDLVAAGTVIHEPTSPMMWFFKYVLLRLGFKS
jgi:hypothetical protein|uniref:Uncharacterized protein n=1 Tax=viral metagenome TaxID=1070528 RepID=A0A6C0IU65_9ZZZZ